MPAILHLGKHTLEAFGSTISDFVNLAFASRIDQVWQQHKPDAVRLGARCRIGDETKAVNEFQRLSAAARNARSYSLGGMSLFKAKRAVSKKMPMPQAIQIVTTTTEPIHNPANTSATTGNYRENQNGNNI